MQPPEEIDSVEHVIEMLRQLTKAVLENNLITKTVPKTKQKLMDDFEKWCEGIGHKELFDELEKHTTIKTPVSTLHNMIKQLINISPIDLKKRFEQEFSFYTNRSEIVDLTPYFDSIDQLLPTSGRIQIDLYTFHFVSESSISKYTEEQLKRIVKTRTKMYNTIVNMNRDDKKKYMDEVKTLLNRLKKAIESRDKTEIERMVREMELKELHRRNRELDE